MTHQQQQQKTFLGMLQGTKGVNDEEGAEPVDLEAMLPSERRAYLQRVGTPSIASISSPTTPTAASFFTAVPMPSPTTISSPPSVPGSAPQAVPPRTLHHHHHHTHQHHKGLESSSSTASSFSGSSSSGVGSTSSSYDRTAAFFASASPTAAGAAHGNGAIGAAGMRSLPRLPAPSDGHGHHHDTGAAAVARRRLSVSTTSVPVPGSSPAAAPPSAASSTASSGSGLQSMSLPRLLMTHPAIPPPPLLSVAPPPSSSSPSAPSSAIPASSATNLHLPPQPSPLGTQFPMDALRDPVSPPSVASPSVLSSSPPPPTTGHHLHDHYDTDFFSTSFAGGGGATPAPSPVTPYTAAGGTASRPTTLVFDVTLAELQGDARRQSRPTTSAATATMNHVGQDDQDEEVDDSNTITLDMLNLDQGRPSTGGTTGAGFRSRSLPANTTMPPTAIPTATAAAAAISSSSSSSSSSTAASPSPPPPPSASHHAAHSGSSDASTLAPSPPQAPTTVYSDPILDHYVLEAVVGVGAFSKVWSAVHRRSRVRRAVKLADFGGGTAPTSVARGMLANEIRVYRALGGECSAILGCFEAAESPSRAVLVLEYAPGGDLFDLLAYRHYDVGMEDAQSITYQMCSALAYMHDRNIVHRDLKLENILLVSRTRPYTIKLSDFGMSMILPSADTRIDSRCGSEEYAAPELIMLTGSAFAPKPADMWAAGVILYALLVGQLPFTPEARDMVVVETVPVGPTDDGELPPEAILAAPEPVVAGTGTAAAAAAIASSAAAIAASAAAAAIPPPTPPPPPRSATTTPTTSTPSSSSSRRASALLRHLETRLAFPRPSRTATTSPQILEGTLLTAPLPPAPSPGVPDSPAPANGGPTVKIIRRRSTRKAGRRSMWHRIARAEFTFPDAAIEAPVGSPAAARLDDLATRATTGAVSASVGAASGAVSMECGSEGECAAVIQAAVAEAVSAVSAAEQDAPDKSQAPLQPSTEAPPATNPYPLLTVETKALVRALMQVRPEVRLTAVECLEDVPWVMAGRTVNGNGNANGL